MRELGVIMMNNNKLFTAYIEKNSASARDAEYRQSFKQDKQENCGNP